MEYEDFKQKEVLASGKEPPLSEADPRSKTGFDVARENDADPSQASPIPTGPTSVPTGDQPQKAPISERKLAANRDNAQHSTGPKTPEGKQKSSRNSYKLGIFARQLFPPTDEGRKEWEKYKDLITTFYSDYRPLGGVEELLLDKVITEAIRYARILAYERQELSRLGGFWNQSIDRVLRYQSSLNRQLTKAIEHLEEQQANRKAVRGASQTCGAVAAEPCEVVGGPFPGIGEHPNRAAAENGSSTRTALGKSSGDAIASQPSPLSSGNAFSELVGTSNSRALATEKYKTNPPSSCPDAENGGTPHKAAAERRSLAEIVERATGVSVAQAQNDPVVLKSGSVTKSQNVESQGPSQQDISDCL